MSKTAVLPSGGFQRKNSWKATSAFDSKLRSFVAKTTFNYLAVRKRQTAWYPEFYNKDQDILCPVCKQAEETVDHFLRCSTKHNRDELAKNLKEQLGKLAKPDSGIKEILTRFIGISTK